MKKKIFRYIVYFMIKKMYSFTNLIHKMIGRRKQFTNTGTSHHAAAVVLPKGQCFEGN